MIMKLKVSFTHIIISYISAVWPFHGKYTDYQGPDFDDMSSFIPCKIDDAIQYINLGYGAIVIL